MYYLWCYVSGAYFLFDYKNKYFIIWLRVRTLLNLSLTVPTVLVSAIWISALIMINIAEKMANPVCLYKRCCSADEMTEKKCGLKVL